MIVKYCGAAVQAGLDSAHGVGTREGLHEEIEASPDRLSLLRWASAHDRRPWTLAGARRNRVAQVADLLIGRLPRCDQRDTRAEPFGQIRLSLRPIERRAIVWELCLGA